MANLWSRNLGSDRGKKLFPLLLCNGGCAFKEKAAELKTAECTAEGLVTLNELKQRLFMVVLVVAIVIAMSAWAYALGWVALKLIQYV
jgi:hypothetical protein